MVANSFIVFNVTDNALLGLVRKSKLRELLDEYKPNFLEIISFICLLFSLCSERFFE